jgi:photosystem II stability/assembly factor-like uncharacterized protein
MFWDCVFTSHLNGWAVGATWYNEEALAIHTNDGGKTWERVLTGAETISHSWLNRVVFVDEKHGWLSGKGGQVACDLPPISTSQHEISFILKYKP